MLSTRHATLTLLISILAAPFSRAQCELEEVGPSTTFTSTLQSFGTQLAADGDRFLVGAYRGYNPAVPAQTGSAFLFERTTSVWTQVAELFPPVGGQWDAFGWSVALSGDVAVVTAPDADRGAVNVGAAYVFARGPSGWQFTQELSPTVSSSLDYFGRTAALDGNTLAVTSPGEGVVYLYERMPSGWSLVQKLTAPDFDLHGQDYRGLALDGDTLLVAAPQFSVVHVFEQAAGAWTLTDRLEDPGGDWTDAFGESVDLHGDLALVGAHGEDTVFDEAGVAHVYERTAAGWVRTAVLTAEATHENARFGKTVALFGDRAIVSSWFLGAFSSDRYYGAAHHFERTHAGWVERGLLVPSADENLYSYAARAAISDNEVFVTAWRSGSVTNGSVRIFLVGGLAEAYCISTPSSVGAPATIEAGSCSFDVAANDLVLNAQPVPDEPGVFCYSSSRTQVPFGDGFLCVGAPIFRLPPSIAVGGVLSQAVDLTNPPSAAGTIANGSTWNFQAYYRDPAAGGSFFNLSDGVRVTFSP